MSPRKIVVLFPNAWDRRQFGLPKYQRDFEFIFHGSDLFTFPGSLQLITFDTLRFIEDTVALCRRVAADGVLSSDEYVGAIIAAAVARELKLPGNAPGAIITAQHKFYSRVAQAKAVPELTPPHALLSLDELKAPLPFPFFAKPCKGTFSLFAFRIDSAERLREKLGFNFLERLVLGRVARPYNALLRAFTDLEHDATAFVAEGLMHGDQVTVDGYVQGGQVEVMGVVDSVMFEGTQSFERFEYPSRLPRAVLQRMDEVTRRVVKAFDFVDGQFNVELFYDRARDTIGVIELNPRLSYQFADLYEYIDGSNSYDVLLSLTLGEPVAFRRGAGEFKKCASFVLRTFNGKRIASAPDDAQVQAVSQRYSEATVKVYGKAGASIKGELRASGSYRYAIINVAAQSSLDLFAIHQDAIDKLPFTFQ